MERINLIPSFKSSSSRSFLFESQGFICLSLDFKSGMMSIKINLINEKNVLKNSYSKKSIFGCLPSSKTISQRPSLSNVSLSVQELFLVLNTSDTFLRSISYNKIMNILCE